MSIPMAALHLSNSTCHMSSAHRPRPRARVRLQPAATASAVSSSLLSPPVGEEQGSISPRGKLDNGPANPDDLFADRRAIFEDFSLADNDTQSPSTRSSISPERPRASPQRGKKSKDDWQAPAWVNEQADRERQREVARKNGKKARSGGDSEAEGSAGESPLTRNRRKRRRSSTPRDKSLTPPPQADPFQRLLAQANIAQSRALAQGTYNPLLPSAAGNTFIDPDESFEAPAAEDPMGDKDFQELLARRKAQLEALNTGAELEEYNAQAGPSNGTLAMVGNGQPVDRGVPIEVSVGMKADPDSAMAKAGNGFALQAFEKKRSFSIMTRDSLASIYDAMAAQTGKQARDIVLIHKGSRIRSPNFSPQQLGMYGFVRLDAYEVSVWNKLQAQTRAAEQERARKLATKHEATNGTGQAGTTATGGASGPAPVQDDEDDFEVIGGAGPSYTPAPAPPPPATAVISLDDDEVVTPVLGQEDVEEEESELVRLTLRGAEGDLKITAKPTTKISSLLSHYASKVMKKTFAIPQPAAPPKKGRKPKNPPPPPVMDPNAVCLYMSVEGEKLDPNSEVGDSDELEDDTMVEIGRV